jgi:hypothetical protein
MAPGQLKMENEALIDDQEPGQTIVDKISDGGFTDGIEIRQIIELLEVQNNGALMKRSPRPTLPQPQWCFVIA